MLKTRVIPTLLLSEGGLVKGSKFRNHVYIGDPINAVKIFNEKSVDEIVFLDISATDEGRGPDFALIREIASEAFMPLGYGGGISSVNEIESLFSAGVEKAIINSAAFSNPKLISEAATVAGSQSIVVSIDVKRSLLGSYEVYVNNGKTRTRMDPVDYASKMEELGAGELIIGSIDREGTKSGYDLKLIDMIARSVEIPVVASGGAGNLSDLTEAKETTAVSALAAGSMFVFHGRHNAVLITYPNYAKLEALFNQVKNES